MITIPAPLPLNILFLFSFYFGNVIAFYWIGCRCHFPVYGITILRIELFNADFRCVKTGGTMKKTTKTLIWIVFVILLLTVGFAAGFPVGQRIGFTTGSEWAIVQADIVAREAGVVMPVAYESGNFRITLRQPRHLYQMAWKLAERHDMNVQCTERNIRE
jgi:hypothetical protein